MTERPKSAATREVEWTDVAEDVLREAARVLRELRVRAAPVADGQRPNADHQRRRQAALALGRLAELAEDARLALPPLDY